MTGAGDRGDTYLPGTGRVRKTHPRVAAFGEVDELSSFIGLARAALKYEEVDELLKTVQESLFHVGAYLANPTHPVEKIRSNSLVVEEWVRLLESNLPPLRHFIYPAGCTEAVLMHVCRAVARRAERAVARVADEEPVDESITAFLNRLSTLFFLLAREMNRRAGVSEEEWRQS
ncbi:MAG: cob(I)yrinic acid a,c-diamide adenosyltransferase [Candidatus Caldarchaeum sp.]